MVDAGRQECFYLKIPIEKDRKSVEQKDKFFFPQIIPNSQISNLKEKFWMGEINEKQKVLLPMNTLLVSSLNSAGTAFAQIDLINKKPHQILEPWYGREPNISKSKKKFF